MKDTGIIRRVDELGRVVIPKEIRKTMFIREGDLMEIYVSDGTLVLKKFSPLGSVADCIEIVSAISKTCGGTAILTDGEKIIAVDGQKKNLFNGIISEKAVDCLKLRKEICLEESAIISVCGEQLSYNMQIFYPILSAGELVGGFILATDGSADKILCVKILECAAIFLSKKLDV